MEQNNNTTAALTEFSIVEIRVIQNNWQHKHINYIADLLNRHPSEISYAISQLDTSNVTLSQNKIIDTAMPRKPKPGHIARRESKFQTRTIDLLKCIRVQIDSRTSIWVKPGTDIEAIKLKYSSPTKY